MWVNGKQVATKESVVGTFRYFQFDISKQLARFIVLLLLSPYLDLTLLRT